MMVESMRLSKLYYVFDRIKISRTQCDFSILVLTQNLDYPSWWYCMSDSGNTYMVRINNNGDDSCDCEGYVHTKFCRHIEGVRKIIGDN